MNKREFFARWGETYRVTRRALELFPEDALDREIIPGAWPPGKLFCHIFAHVNVVLNACVTKRLNEEDLCRFPDDVDPTSRRQLLRYAENTMNQMFVHASVGDEVWSLSVATSAGEVPMDTLCLDSFAHELHHRGQLVLMLRALGIAPPAVCRHALCRS